MDNVRREKQGPRFDIFKWEDAGPYTEDVMYLEPLSNIVKTGWAELCEAGYNDGADVRLLFSTPGFSLTYAWFKSGVPLPRHSHNSDCLYYIISGSLKMGTEVLGSGDGFFIGADVAYSYVPEENGVEILEFRTSNRFNMRFLANNPAFWDKAIKTVREKKSGWSSEEKPTSSTE